MQNVFINSTGELISVEGIYRHFIAQNLNIWSLNHTETSHKCVIILTLVWYHKTSQLYSYIYKRWEEICSGYMMWQLKSTNAHKFTKIYYKNSNTCYMFRPLI
jgi:hypothetical protein